MAEGYTPIPDPTLQAWAAAGLSGAQAAVLLCIARQTLGWGRDDTQQWCSLSRLQAATNRSRGAIVAALDALQVAGLIESAGVGARGVRRWRLVQSADRCSQPTGRSTEPVTGRSTGTELVQPADPLDRQVRDKEENTHRAREQGEEGAERGRAQVGSEPMHESVDRLWRTLAPVDSRHRQPRAMRAIDAERAMTIVEAVGAAEALRVADAVGKAGMGWVGFSRCFDDDGALRPDQLPGAKPKRRGKGGAVNMDHDALVAAAAQYRRTR